MATDVMGEMARDNSAGPKLGIEIPGQHGAWRCNPSRIIKKCKRDEYISLFNQATLASLGADCLLD